MQVTLQCTSYFRLCCFQRKNDWTTFQKYATWNIASVKITCGLVSKKRICGVSSSTKFEILLVYSFVVLILSLSFHFCHPGIMQPYQIKKFKIFERYAKNCNTGQKQIKNKHLPFSLYPTGAWLEELRCHQCGPDHSYRNFRPITRTADYPQRSIFVVRGKKVQQITRTGLLPAPQNKRKSCYCITGIRTHKLGEMNIPCCCLQSERSITFSAKNWLLTMQP